ncbi:SIR2 family protein [Echinicola sp. CAU 1574]|uniref:SIR2 family protein n=1 Tax=Echinicola arenosa TaxID=2774144 RepID=A0ABR9AR74_9BACT|nr:SIR2 family protein [Echinicola arenosa]MBD8490866.1 SIR2 family protein [Echinicola arenosa]
MNITDVIITGAGASAAEGIPIQSQLFKKFWVRNSESLLKVRSIQNKDQLRAFDIVLDNIDRYLQRFFNVDVLSIQDDKVQFPTFEEALGILDLALTYGEEFEDSSEGDIKTIQSDLIFLIAKSILQEMPNSPQCHVKLVDELFRMGRLQSTAFLTTNYDLLLDDALIQKVGSGNLDYRVVLLRNDESYVIGNESITLLKLHGSLDWIYCPSSKTLIKESVERIIPNDSMTPFFECANIPRPVIIPPSFIKSLSNFYIQQIWMEAEKIIRDAERLIFCGYSFPDADLNFKYLLKRSQLGSKTLREVVVINNHQGKAASVLAEESNRYRRFFGPGINVKFSDWSFGDFANNPSIIDRN